MASITEAASKPDRPPSTTQNVVAALSALLPLIFVGLLALYFENVAGYSHMTETVFLIFVLNFCGWVTGSAFKTEKFYDMLGTSSYIAAALFTLSQSQVCMDWNSPLWIKQVALSALVFIWAGRLGSYLILPRVSGRGGQAFSACQSPCLAVRSILGGTGAVGGNRRHAGMDVEFETGEVGCSFSLQRWHCSPPLAPD